MRMEYCSKHNQAQRAASFPPRKFRILNEIDQVVAKGMQIYNLEKDNFKEL